MLQLSRNISPIRRTIIRSIRFRRSLLRSSRRTTLRTMSDIFGIRFFRPSGAWLRFVALPPRLAPWAAFLRRSAAKPGDVGAAWRHDRSRALPGFFPSRVVLMSAYFPASRKGREKRGTRVSPARHRSDLVPARPIFDFKCVSFAPPGLVRGVWVCFPRLAPWAAFFRSFGAGGSKG